MQRTLFLILFAFPLLISAQNERSLSPYFIVNVDSGEAIPDFPLKSTSADVTISGVVADVTVTQVYTNHSANTLEAIYVFPGSTNAAVYEMEMQIGRRVIEAQIMQKDSARKKYESAKQEGKTASLLEQQRPNVFTMNVANVLPGDSIIVRMSYTERLVPTDGIYEFVYPTVVGPRYSGVGAPVASLDKNTGLPAGEIPYTKKGVKPLYDFGISVKIASGIPYEFIRSTSHKTLLSFESKNAATVLLDTSEIAGGNRDYILQYRFVGGTIETGLMLYEGKDENFFMLMIEPPKRVPLDSIPPREYIFVMDVSGSMSGFPLEISKKLMRNLLSGLRPTDKFNVIQFAGGSALMSPASLDATSPNIDSAIAFVNRVQSAGGTELDNAMRRAMFIPASAGYSRSIVIVTDGLISAEARVLKSMRDHLDSANVFAFGIHSGCNRYLIEAMAFCGGGEPTVVTNSNEADAAAEKFRQYILAPVLTKVNVQYNGFDVYDVEPAAVPDLFASRPLIITGKYRGEAEGKITVSGMTGAGAYHKEISVDSVKPSRKNKAIRLLWARDKIKYLSYLDNPGSSWYGGYTPTDTSVEKQITDLGLKYNLLTNYTSFVAVDKRVRNKNPEEDSTVTQPLPLTEGMDNSAIGMSGTLQEVSILSYRGAVQVNTCYANINSVACCIVAPSRPVFSPGPGGLIEPTTAGDFNRYYNGGFILPLMSYYSQPFFTAGASGRMASLLSTEMIGTYTLGTYSMDGSPMSSPLNSGSIGFNSWTPRTNQLNVSATHYGTQNLYFSNSWNINDKWNSVLEIGEQWKGINTDRNKDGYEDLSDGLSLSMHHRLSYHHENTTNYLSGNFYNDLYVHSSWLNAGQISAQDPYKTFDRTMGFYICPRAIVEVNDGNYIDIKASVAAASMENGWGVDRFHLNTTQIASEADYDWGSGTLSYNAGVDGWFSLGEEQWNTSRFSAAHQSAGAHLSLSLQKNGWSGLASVRSEINDIGGFAILPAIRFGRTVGNYSFSIGVNRYRDQAFAIGQLLPLFYSSRELVLDSDPGLNQGWDFRVTAGLDEFLHREIYLGITYEAILPEHSIIIDVYSDDSKISVYGADKGPLIHRALTKFNFDISEQWNFEADYVVTITPYKYGETIHQQPLLPMQRGYASVQWKSTRKGLYTRVQVCYTGEQRIPQAGWSPDYATVNLQAKYKLSDRFTVFANAFNILDYRQKQFLMTSTDQFDGWKLWAPVTGRTFQAGVSMQF
jgi:Ca-activated chloride channel homolog